MGEVTDVAVKRTLVVLVEVSADLYASVRAILGERADIRVAPKGDPMTVYRWLRSTVPDIVVMGVAGVNRETPQLAQLIKSDRTIRRTHVLGVAELATARKLVA